MEEENYEVKNLQQHYQGGATALSISGAQQEVQLQKDMLFLSVFGGVLALSSPEQEVDAAAATLDKE